MNPKKTVKQTRNDKKALVTADPDRRRIIPLVLAALVLAVAVGAAYYLTGPPDTVQAALETTQTGATSASNDSVSYPLKDFDSGKARFYKYEHNGQAIKYFILKSSDGVIRAAFDACDVCWQAGKGYTQEGDNMICRNCGRQFASVMINEVQGGCNPAPLKRNIEGDQLVIRVQDIMTGQRYFDI